MIFSEQAPDEGEKVRLAKRADECEIKISVSETSGSLFAGCQDVWCEPAITRLLGNKIISFIDNFHHFLNF